MTREQLQQQCEIGQQQLMSMDYLAAIETLSAAEEAAWEAKDYDTLSRLYMPLQEARRQVRQRCGEGIVKLDEIATGPGDFPDARDVLVRFPHGQLLMGGWGSVQPAARLRKLARENKCYVETFLAAVFPLVGGVRAVVIVPREDARLPDPQERSIDQLLRMLPPHCIVIGEGQLPRGTRHGDARTYAEVMAWWEQLHAPFLAAAEVEADPVRRMAAYRGVILVDQACELAHQELSDVARAMRA